MTRRLLFHDDLAGILEEQGEGVTPERVAGVLAGPPPGADGVDRLLAQVISGEIDVDKMDYLLRDSLFCGVRYGSYDLDRLLDTMMPLQDWETGAWVIGVDEGGVHALEALVLARYYMFTQVYFNVTGKALELHLTRWLASEGQRWPDDPESFLAHDDVTVTAAMRASDHPHARAVVEREHFPLAFETGEHLSAPDSLAFAELLPRLRERVGADAVLESHSAKDSHRFGQGTLLVRGPDGKVEGMEQASHFIRHLQRIDRYRVYARPEVREEVAELLGEWWAD
jgi:HD superfamily phosphohydrolase